MSSEKITNTFETDKVKNLIVEVACAEVIFEKSVDSQIYVEAEDVKEGIYNCEIRGDRLVVTYEFPRKVVSYCNEIDTRIRLFLPTALLLERVELEIGAGSMKAVDMPVSCQDMSVDVGAGKWKAEQLSVSGCLDIKVGAGKVSAKTMRAGKLHIDCGVGDCTYEGEVNGDITVNCGVGNCKLKLDNKESDFNYDISCALGKVSINGTKVKHLGSERLHAGGNVLGMAVLECGLGKITMETA